MPHDKNKKKIGPGDIVTIRAKVDTVQTGEEFCNLNVITIEPMPPYPSGTSITLNTRQVELVEKAKPAPADED